MTFSEWWRAFDPREDCSESYRNVAEQAWAAATERAAKVVAADIFPDDAYGLNATLYGLAARIRGHAPPPPTRPMTPDEERAALERSVARHGDAGSPPG